MSKAIIAAGLLMYRMREGRPEVFLVHPGGPFFKNKDLGEWSVPKGELDGDEDIFAAAQREFTEETGFKSEGPFVPLGSASRPGKTVHAWAFQGDVDPTKLVSNTCEIEWPPRSGKKMTIPEADRGEYFTLEVAKTKMFKYMVPILEAFEREVK